MTGPARKGPKPKPALVQVIGLGGRTPEQQAAADRAGKKRMQVVEITVKDARRTR